MSTVESEVRSHEVQEEDGPPAEEINSLDPPVLLQKFTLYETRDFFYIVGSNTRETLFRVLRISLDEKPQDIAIEENYPVLTRSEMMAVLENLEKEAIAANDVLSKRITAWGIVGIVRFTSCYYLCLVTKCSPVALLGGHFMSHIDETKLVPIMHSSVYRPAGRRSTEARLAGIFHSMDLSKNFYFSGSYDLTNTLQSNLLREKQRRSIGLQEIFVWNHFLLKPLLERFEGTMDWCLSLIHGFIDQAKVVVFGNPVYVTLIARRSHYFAGARFYKRGTTQEGHVANEVETEQIVSNQLISSFHDPRTGRFNSPRYTSYVQHRGSIPLSWSQGTNNMSIKPPIKIDAVDPFYSAAARHFDSLFGRYGAPVRVLNLVKKKEKQPRESVLGQEFANCISYLNQFMPEGNKIHYTAWDMSRVAKGRASEVIDFLEKYALATLEDTDIFHNGTTLENTRVQHGICRTNCIDCLDRTNAAQSVLGKCAFGKQLEAIGIIDNPNIEYDTDAVDILTEMYHDQGDTLALQYGGSNLVNTVETYRKINQWRSHSRDIIEAMRRFYSNSFMDANRQDAINVFLGNYEFDRAGIELWGLSTDYYLHHNLQPHSIKISYTQWYTPLFLVPMRERLASGAPMLVAPQENAELPGFMLQLENYWNRLYQPKVLTSLTMLFARRMNSTERYLSDQSTPTSPFEVHRKPGKRKSRLEPVEKVKTALMLDEQEEETDDGLVDEYTALLHPKHVEEADYSIYYVTGFEPVNQAAYKPLVFEWEEPSIDWPVQAYNEPRSPTLTAS